MSLIAKGNSGGDFEPLPEGNYIARCYQLIDLGTQVSEFNGEKKSHHKVLVAWEVLDPETNMKDGRPFSIYKRYTVSLNEKSQLFADLQAWRGVRFTPEELEGFNLEDVLGAYCSIQVLHETKGDRTYENITAIMFTREKPEPVNELVKFDLSNPDLQVFSSLSERLQETIKKSPEGAKLEAVGALDPAAEQLDPQDFPADDLAVVNMNEAASQGSAEKPDEAEPKAKAVSATVDSELADALSLIDDELEVRGKKTALQKKVFTTKVLGTSQASTMEHAEAMFKAIEELDRAAA